MESRKKPQFVMLVGLPGSGKSTYAESLKSDYKVHSSDAIREELLKDVNNQENNPLVFSTLHKRVTQDLNDGFNVICDATNISWKRRKAFLNSISHIECEKKAVVIATPYEICLKLNDSRERKVPKEVIQKMYYNFDVPFYNEGWDNIEVLYLEHSHKSYYGAPEDFIVETLDLDQHNKHHRLKLGAHCMGARDIVDISIYQKASISSKYNELRAAAILHDCGKVVTKSFLDHKGNETEDAHYYNHENVGSYNSLFYRLYDADGFCLDKLYVAALIRWHMIMHHFKNWEQQTIDRYTNEFIHCKNDFWNNLKILHEADVYAH